MFLLTYYAFFGLIGGVVGAGLLRGLFHVFCRNYLKGILVEASLRNTELADVVKSQVLQGIERVVTAIKTKIPLVSMFLGPGKEAELKKVAVEELVSRAPNIPPEAFDVVVGIVQNKVGPWMVLAGFIVGGICSMFVVALLLGSG